MSQDIRLSFEDRIAYFNSLTKQQRDTLVASLSFKGKQLLTNDIEIATARLESENAYLESELARTSRYVHEWTDYHDDVVNHHIRLGEMPHINTHTKTKAMSWAANIGDYFDELTVGSLVASVVALIMKCQL